MEIRQLRYFVQIVESGSLLKASRQIYVAQPALSQQLAKLEHEIGAPLLHRSSRGVVPTPSGRALYEHAKFLLRHMEQAIHAAREGSPASGMVSVGMSPAIACVLGLPLLLHLRATHPSIVLNVIEGLSGHLFNMARAGALDIAILFEDNPALGMSSTPLLVEELVLIVAADSPLLPPGQTELTIAEIAQIPMVLATRAHWARRYLESELERLQLQLQLVAEIDALPLTMAAVRHGVGATIQARAILLGEADPGAFRVVRLAPTGLLRSSYLFGPSAAHQFPAATVVLAEIRKTVEHLVADGTWKGVTLRHAPDE